MSFSASAADERVLGVGGPAPKNLIVRCAPGLLRIRLSLGRPRRPPFLVCRRETSRLPLGSPNVCTEFAVSCCGSAVHPPLQKTQGRGTLCCGAICGQARRLGHPPRSNRWLVERRGYHRRVIQREISRVLVLNPLWQKRRCFRTAQDNFVLDTAFVLIEGHPGGLG